MGLQELEAMVQKTATAGEPFERGADEAEQRYLSSVAARPNTKLICEVGFNAGFSSWAFLEASLDTSVVSFDLADYSYSDAAKAHIDKHFPGRHTLIEGDSHTTIGAYAKEHPDVRFDVIFIDGDHSLEGARADLDDLRSLAAPKSIVIMDDLTPWLWFGEGPTQAWREAVDAGRVLHTSYFRDGEPVDEVTPPAARAWAEGRYSL